MIKKKINKKFATALFLMIISNLGWLLPLILVPVLKISIQAKALLTTGCIIFGQITYNIGFFMIGGQFIKRLKNKKINLKYFWTQINIFYLTLRVKNITNLLANRLKKKNLKS
jgi:hypothetical protein